MRKQHRVQKLCAAGAYLIALNSQCASASAQSDMQPQSQEADEIVVTATRRETGVNDIPVTIQALSSKQLAQQGAYDFNSYSRSVTGLSALDRGPGQQLITLRGISADTSATNTDAPEQQETTAIYFDETPVSMAGFNPDLQLVDIERVEVLKGPQGTLFGSGALAGAVRLIGNKPDLERFGGSTEAEVSAYENGGANFAGNLVVNLPISEGVSAVRLTAYTRRDGGFIDNVGLRAPDGSVSTDDNANRSWSSGGRLQFRLAPSERLDVNVKAIYQETRLHGTQNVDQSPLAAGGANPLLPAGLVLGPYEQFRPAAEPYRDRILVLNTDATVHLEAMDLVSASSYLVRRQRASIDFTYSIPGYFGIGELQNPGSLLNATNVNAFIQELRVVSSDKQSPLQWIAGAFFSTQKKRFDQDLESDGVNNDNGGVFGSDNLLRTQAHFDDRQISAFGELSYSLGRTTITAGLRYFDFRSIYTIRGEGAGVGGTLDIPARRTADRGFNPKFNVSYKIDDERLLYIQAARGFRLGGINDPLLSFCSSDDAATFVENFKSDHLWNYEAGAKLGWLGGRLHTNISGYRIDWSKVPITRQLACGVSNTVTAGSLRVKGLEFDASLRITPTWRVYGGFSYTDSRIKAIASTVSAQTGIVVGERAAGVAPWAANINSHIDLPLSGGNAVYIDAGIQYVGPIYNYPGTLDPRRIRQPDYVLGNTRVGWQKGATEVALFINNIANKRAVLFNDRILGTTRDSINRPRTFGISAKTGF